MSNEKAYAIGQYAAFKGKPRECPRTWKAKTMSKAAALGSMASMTWLPATPPEPGALLMSFQPANAAFHALNRAANPLFGNGPLCGRLALHNEAAMSARTARHLRMAAQHYCEGQTEAGDQSVRDSGVTYDGREFHFEQD